MNDLLRNFLDPTKRKALYGALLAIGTIIVTLGVLPQFEPAHWAEVGVQVIGIVAIAGLPPFGIFMSEFLLVTSTFAREPLLAIPLVAGLLVAFGALLARLNDLSFGEPQGSSEPISASLVPLYLHLAIVLVAGFYLPAPLVEWFQHVAKLLG